MRRRNTKPAKPKGRKLIRKTKPYAVHEERPAGSKLARRIAKNLGLA